MTEATAYAHRRPTQGAAPFDANELFFSRTDERGVILSGNTVFQRVADYPWDDLLNAPHKIIRHPDMPR
ncbi:MAG: chemotaxis protein, partial [Pseudomonadota bacterium]